MALSTGEDVCIGVIDVGSPKSGNLGWAIRKGEGSRPWSASAGATVLTVALPVVTYTLGQLRTGIEAYEASLDWKSWGAVSNQLLVWEAFVSGSSKGGEHWHDADIAAGAFQDGLDNLDAINAIAEPDVLSARRSRAYSFRLG